MLNISIHTLKDVRKGFQLNNKSMEALKKGNFNFLNVFVTSRFSSLEEINFYTFSY